MKRKLLLASALVLGGLSLTQAQSITGKINLSKGQKFEEVSTIKANTSMEMMGNQMETKTETISNNELELKDNAADYLFANTFKRFRMNVSMMGQEQKVDTDNKADLEGPMGQGFKDIINKTQEISVSKNGLVKDIKMPGGDGASAALAAMNGMQNTYSVGAPFAAITTFGGKALKVGETWQEKVTTEALASDITYKLESVSGGEAAVSFTGNTVIKTTTEQQGMEMKMEMSGPVKGTMVVDPATGLVKKRNTTMDATGSMEVMGQKVPLKIASTTESVITKK